MITAQPSQTSKFNLMITAAYSVFLATNWLLLIYSATLLRPSADDYCFGMIVGKYGILMGVANWWNNWSAYLYSMLLGNLLVGAPLAYLPLSMASGIPFLLSLLGIGWAALALIPDKTARHNNTLACVLSVGLGWWVFLWTRVAFGKAEGDLSMLAHGATHWQTLNATYIIGAVFLFLGFAFILNQRHPIEPQTTVLVFILGALAGLAGSAVSLAFFSFGLLAAFFCLSKTRGQADGGHKAQFAYWIIFCCAIVLAAILSHTLSPGQQARMAVINPDTSISTDRVISLLEFTIPFSIKFVLKAYFGHGSVFVLLLATSTSACFHTRLTADNTTTTAYAMRGLCFFIFSLILTSSARIGEAFSYAGYWHFLLPSMCIYLSMVYIGIYAGTTIMMQFKNTKMICLSLLVLCMITATAVNIHAHNNILKRNARWEVGPAPISGISDIEDADGWQRNCWDQLNKSRKQPLERQQQETCR